METTRPTLIPIRSLLTCFCLIASLCFSGCGENLGKANHFAVSFKNGEWIIGAQGQSELILADGTKTVGWYLLEQLKKPVFDSTDLATIELIHDDERSKDLILYKDSRGHVMHVAAFDPSLPVPIVEISW